ncbi:MAG: hypothetical protein ACP5U2_07635, partial [Bryobacteraceae bacterium]
MLALVALWVLPALPPAAVPASLSIAAVTLHQYEGGPPLGPSFQFGRGESVFVRYRVLGFTRSREARVHLECTLDAMDPRGIRLVE